MAVPNISQSPMDLSLLVGGAGIGFTPVTFGLVLAGLLGTAKVLDDHLFGFNGRIVSIEFRCTVPATTAAKALTLTPSLGGVNLTGGVLALTSANCTAGARVAATAITGLNSFTPTTPFDETLSGVTAFIEGSGELVINCYNDDTRNAIALGLALRGTL